MSFDKQTVKEYLELEDIYNLLDYLGGEPQMFSNYIVSRTICHQGDTHKLYYYENTQLFRCYTGECGAFDVFELIQKIEEIEDLNKAIYFIVNFFNLQGKIAETDEDFSLEDWNLFRRYNKLDEITLDEKKHIELPQLSNLIKYYPSPILLDWVAENINPEVCNYMGIKYDGVNGSILIPHYDIDNRLIGIRQRTLVQEQEVWGKYKPAKIDGKLCNHPLAFNLYGLNKAKENISKLETAIVVESEKSVLQYISYFGTKSNICVAVCGSSISKYQLQLLLECGAKEVVIGFDKDFKDFNSEDRVHVTNKLEKINQKFGNQVVISYLFDVYDLLGEKCSPTDCGKQAFEYLWRHRVVL